MGREFDPLPGHEKNIDSASLGAVSVFFDQPGLKNGLSFKNYRSLCVARRKLKLFKEPKIIRCKNGDWFVQYYFRDPENSLKWQAFKERCGINYIKETDQKEKEIEILRVDVLNWLESGNSPFDKEAALSKEVAEVEARVKKAKPETTAWSLQKAIDEYRHWITIQGHSANTVRSYNKYLKAFEAWLSAKNITQQQAALFTEIEVKLFLDEQFARSDNSGQQVWSARTYNNYQQFMITFFGRARLLEKNATKNRNLKYEFNAEDLEPKITVPERNKAFTPFISEKIKEELKMPGYENLKDFLEWIFLSLMRPGEIRDLKVEKIDLVNRQIRIIGKTGDRIVPISDQLMDLIERRGLSDKSLQSYVFGHWGDVDERIMGVDYFREKFAEIRKKLKLSTNYGPYSYKHTGVIAMIKAGFADREIMVLSGHKTQQAFEAYKRDLIIENTHVMKGSTVNF